ncbi:MAG: DUF4445 domain-containing protein [Verrucomicrobia bacterium]|nr:DUF4445 domain-containing protein [Verrucomicrobiota bacterium]
MNDSVHIELLPQRRTLTLERGTPLQDVLFAQGVEFPCGGRGRCKGCRVKVLEGALPVSAEDQRLLSAEQITEGWRLACRARAECDLKIELAQWEAAILADDTVFEFTPRDGLGVAVDLGTTTVVAQLLDLRSGHVLAVRMGLNAQARHGADIMSRVDFSAHGGGQATLQNLIREQIGGLLEELLAAAQSGVEVKNVVLVGNTVMHHLFSGVSVEPLSHSPFEPVEDGLKVFGVEEVGWRFAERGESDRRLSATATKVKFLPGLGSFVGSDILAGVLATKLHESDELVGLVDLGTNGEIVIGNRERMLCASTAAGPAFEGARISMGMRAATGAISEVHLEDGQLRCHVLGNGPARGICGSGLVDAIAAGLELGWIQSSGKLTSGKPIELVSPVVVTQADVRELQLAKGAIAAGIRILTQQWGARVEDISRLYLAGAFGNYISRASARRIGLLHFPPEKIVPAGNTALLGAKLALFSLQEHDGAYAELRRRIHHVSLNEDPQFHDIYVEEMGFPESA